MKNKKRHICFLCKGKKYTKYLEYNILFLHDDKEYWFCKNQQKCQSRGANYKK